MYRLITGRVAKTDDHEWVNAPVIFQRIKGNFTFEKQYPPDIIRAKTDNLGNLFYVNSSGVTFSGVPLWVNEIGDLVTVYDCILPKDRFKFSLPAGDGSPIELSVLRAGSQPQEAYPQSLITYIDGRFETITPADLHYQVFIPTNNQITFNLSDIPIAPSRSRVYLNGLKQRFGVDYNINSNLLNWFDIPLISSYILEVYF